MELSFRHIALFSPLKGPTQTTVLKCSENAPVSFVFWVFYEKKNMQTGLLNPVSVI